MLLPVDFDYHRPDGLEQAVRLLGEFGERGRVIAGGTDLVLEMKRGAVRPEALVDVRSIPELSVLADDGGRLRIGAACTFAAIAGSALVRAIAPSLARAASLVGSPQVRSRGTIGGNVGTRSPAGDSLPALVAHGAEALVAGAHGARTIPVATMLSGGADLQPGELLQEFMIRKEAGVRGAFVKVGRRNALAIARISVAVVLCTIDGKAEGRVVLGTLGPAPVRVPDAEAILKERGLDPAVWPAVADAASLAVHRSIPGRPTAAYKMRAARGIMYEALENMTHG